MKVRLSLPHMQICDGCDRKEANFFMLKADQSLSLLLKIFSLKRLFTYSRFREIND